MTDPTLSIPAALREAQLQRLEASLASKAEAKPQSKTVGQQNKQSLPRS